MTPPATSSLPPVHRSSRPLGVALLSVLVGLYGILWVVLGALVLAGVAIGAAERYLGAVTSLGSVTAPLVVGLILFVVGLVILGIALALWRLRLWALVLALLVLVFEMVVDGLAGNFYSLGFILAVILFVYLLAVSRHFR
jgi:hypothetical protein